MSKDSLEKLKLFHFFASISEGIQYTIKFIGDVKQFYTRKYDDDGVLQTLKATNSRQCNSCHEFLLSSLAKPLRKIFPKCSALFQNIVEIQYNPTLVESNQ